MKFIAYADLHFHHAWSEFNQVDEDSLSSRFKVQLAVWEQIDALAKQYDATKLFAGDLFHKRSFLHTTVFTEVLKRYKASDVPELLIPGNHDRYDQQYDSVTALAGIGDAKVLQHGEEMVYPEGEDWSISITGISPGGPVPAPSKHKYTRHILLAHGAMYGAKAQNGFEMESGYKLDDFKGWDLVVMGDIHMKQEIGNVLIPGSPLQHDWGHAGLECGCWLLDVSAKGIKKTFLPLEAPRFIVVTQANIEETFKIEQDSYNFYDFRISQKLSREEYAEIKKRFPNSYVILQPEVKQATSKTGINRKSTLDEILQAYFSAKHKDQSAELVKLAKDYLLRAAPNLSLENAKHVEFTRIKAKNFLAFEDVELDLSALRTEPYLVVGTSDDETAKENGVGKTALAVEIISFTLFDTLARSATRSKDRLIHDPEHGGKAKNLFTEVELKIGDTRYIIQRYRKHTKLGTGCRVLVEEKK